MPNNRKREWHRPLAYSIKLGNANGGLPPTNPRVSPGGTAHQLAIAA
jgi:hypothetical protein